MANELLKEAFEYTMNELHKEYKEKNNEDEFKMWFNMNYIESTIDTITVSVASSFMKTMMNSKGYFDIFQKKISSITAQNITINCIIQNEANATSKNNESESSKKSEPDYSMDSQKNSILNFYSTDDENSDEEDNEDLIIEKKSNFRKHPLLQEQFTFDTFIPGENSDFAYKASIAVSQNPGKKYNPILIYGGSGLGKTHLMQAIGNAIYNSEGGDKLKIYYGSAENFANEFTSSITAKKTNQFNNKFRNLDVLLLDDIHFLDNKKGIQEELFYTFNALHDKQAQMIFTCDRPIKEIKNMTDRLVSRLSNGLCIDITIPNYETRIAILKKKLEIMEMDIDPEIIDFIAKNVESNVRELESALKQIIAYAEIIEQKPTLEMAQNQLKDILNMNTNHNISLEIIQKVVGEHYQISIAELKNKKRDNKTVIPRHIAFYIARELTELTYTEIGEGFGGRDHATVMNAYQKIQKQISIDSSLESRINLIIKEIKEYNK